MDSDSDSDSDSDLNPVSEDNDGSSNKNKDNSENIKETRREKNYGGQTTEKEQQSRSTRENDDDNEDATKTTGTVPLKTVQSGDSVDKVSTLSYGSIHSMKTGSMKPLKTHKDTIEGQVRAYVKKEWYGTIIKHWQEKNGLVSVGVMVESFGNSGAVDVLPYVPTAGLQLAPPYYDIILPFIVITAADSEMAKVLASFSGTVALNTDSVEILANEYRRYGNADNEEFYYFVTRILSAVNPGKTNFKLRKAKDLISTIFTVTDEAFALMIIDNDGSADGWDKEGRRVFAKLCKKVQTLREDPETGKNLEKMMLERFNSESNPTSTVSKDGGTVASSLAEEENEDDNFTDPALMQLLGEMEEGRGTVIGRVAVATSTVRSMLLPTSDSHDAAAAAASAGGIVLFCPSTQRDSGTFQDKLFILAAAAAASAATAILQHREAVDNKEEDADDADANATATMMLTQNVTQSQINQNNNHWDEEPDRDGEDSDEEGSLAAAFDVQIGCNNSKDDAHGDNADGNNNNDNNNNELHGGMKQQLTPTPHKTTPPQTTTRGDLKNQPGMMVTTLAAGTDSAINRSLRKDLVVGTCTTSFHLDGWKFHYQNWVPEEDTPTTFSHRYTSSRDLFPQERKEKLDMAKLRKHGLQLGRVLDSEDEKKANGILRRKPFYSEVLKWSNNYYANQANNGKGHYIGSIKLSELIHFDGIVLLHGTLGIQKDSICYRWTKIDTLYSPTRMSWYQWRQIKSNLKMNCNHEAKYNMLLCKDDMSKFNYACKFDYIYETLIHNVHYFSKKACSDLCMDESSWLGQEGVCTGTNSTKHNHPTVPRHVIPEIGKLWSSPPHLTADNFFNGDSILDLMGGLGFGMIGTVVQNRLPNTVEKDNYFHKENASYVSGKRCSRVARLCNPGTIVKKLYLQAYDNLDQIDSAISKSNIGYKS
eukprot:jgi/Psemu1/29563/gm1.29563_g